MLGLGDFSIQNILSAYNGSGMYIALYCVTLLYILIKGDKRDKAVFLYPSLFIAVTILNPLFAPFFMDIGGEDATYYRFFWALPIVILLTYTATKVIVAQKKNSMKLIVVASCIIVIIICGNFILTDKSITPANNAMKVSDGLLQVNSIIKEDQAKDEVLVSTEPIAVIPDDLVFDFRLYDPSIKLAYGRNEVLGLSLEKDFENIAVLLQVFSQGQPVSGEALKKAIQEENIDYMVLPISFGLQGLLDETGVKPIAATADYFIYKNTK